MEYTFACAHHQTTLSLLTFPSQYPMLHNFRPQADDISWNTLSIVLWRLYIVTTDLRCHDTSQPQRSCAHSQPSSAAWPQALSRQTLFIMLTPSLHTNKRQIFPPARPLVLDLISSTRPRARLIPGTIHAPQLQRIPCHAYLPTLVLHFAFGHSSRPSSFPCSSSDRIQERGSRKRCAHGGEGVEVVVTSDEMGPFAMDVGAGDDLGLCGIR